MTDNDDWTPTTAEARNPYQHLDRAARDRAVKAEALRTVADDAYHCPEPTAPTTPGVVLDPFGGTGTTATVAKALGRRGISVDMSADYCRLAEWRTNDPAELDKARYGVGRHKEGRPKKVKAATVVDLPTEPDLFGEGVA